MKVPPIKKTGTTTVGMICKDGVVLAAEKKSTLGYLVASKESIKILPIEDHIAITIAGASGDAQALARYMKAECKLFSIQTNRKITTQAAATLLSNILQSGRWTFLPYMVQLLIAGYDDSGPSIFSLDPIGSIEEEKKFFSTGSGSPIALGVLEDKYKDGISVEEGIKLAAKAIRAAIERDIASGGKTIDIAVITKEGFRLLEKEKVENALKV
ncbi:MAG: archaeal proteasome endopeptidase complex subunit beta [Candidatus Aenigmarchaeota archaeon]|nr:archaeal proteasome endopeptidase complex subunit beta [Candidatus Aenigmarchaeota archaeon]